MSGVETEGRLFGTDGIRGRYGEGFLVPGRVSTLGRVIGEVVAGKESGGRRAIVGHDGRRSGPELELALARGLHAAGFTVTSAGLITTPGLAVLTRLSGFDVGAMISASHNPASDNGIKVFGTEGDKLPDATEDEIERRLRAGVEPVLDGPGPELDPRLEEAYLAHLQGVFSKLRLDGLAIALDCANGGGSRVAPRILGRLGGHGIPVACSPDGDNINQDCGSTHPAALQEAVRLHGADLGIALDGDGDRCLLVDETGNLVNGDALLVLLARHAAKRGCLPRSRIVATVMSNRGLHRALREAGIGVVTVGVGDRRVVEALKGEGLALGGEQSGHIVFGSDNHFIGDGIYTALRVLTVLKSEGGKLSELARSFVPFPQVLVNVQVAKKPNLAEIPAVADAIQRVEATLGGEGRVLLRYSGTEPLARIMIEGPDEMRIRGQAQELARLVSRELNGGG
jgi:phosphoglucosamine mutase